MNIKKNLIFISGKFFKFSLLFMFLTITNITRSAIPELKGLHNLFSTDVIGIGQALFAKGWIENVYTYAPNDNKAKIVIEQFFHKQFLQGTKKINEFDNFVLTKLAPGSCITPEIFGKLFNFLSILSEKEAIKVFVLEKKELMEGIKKQVKDKHGQAGLANAMKVINLIVDSLSMELGAKESKDSGKVTANIFVWGILEYENCIEFLKNININTLSKKNSYKELELEIFKNKEIRDLFKEYLQKKQANSESVKKTIEVVQKLVDCTKNAGKEPEEDELIDKKKELIDIWFDACKGEKIQKTKVKYVVDCIESLKKSSDFIPETAEVILWAVFNKKFNTKKDLDACLKELGKSIDYDKWEKDEYKKFKEDVVKIDQEEFVEKITSKDYYDFATYSMIKFANFKIIPTKAEQQNLSYRKKTKEFPTCFESTLLDMFSILLYDPKENKYDKKMLPAKALSGSDFAELIEKVFSSSSGELILQGNINNKVQQWIDIIENLPEIAYNKSEGDIRYDLNTSFENLIKILNKFYSFGLDIKSDKNNLNNTEINISKIKEITSKEDAQEFWNQLFSFVASKLSTEERAISFKVEVQGKDKKIARDESGIVKTEKTNGVVAVKIRYKDFDYKEFDVDFEININSGHAYLTCKKRDELGLSFLSEKFIKELENEFFYKKNSRIYPGFILLSNLKTKELIEDKNNNKIKNLLYYCFNLKDANIKVKFIKEMFLNNYENKSFYNLVENLVNIMIDDPYIICLLIKFFLINNSISGVDKLLNMLIEKNVSGVSYLILKKEFSFNEELDNKIIKKSISSDENKNKMIDIFKNKISDIQFLIAKENVPELSEIIKKTIEESSDNLIFQYIRLIDENIAIRSENNSKNKEILDEYLSDKINNFFSKDENCKKFVDIVISEYYYVGNNAIKLLNIIKSKKLRNSIIESLVEKICIDFTSISSDASVNDYNKSFAIKKNFQSLIEMMNLFVKEDKDLVVNVLLKYPTIISRLIEYLLIAISSFHHEQLAMAKDFFKKLFEKSSNDLIFEFLDNINRPRNEDEKMLIEECLSDKITKYLVNKDNRVKMSNYIYDGIFFNAKQIIDLIKDKKLKNIMISDIFKNVWAKEKEGKLKGSHSYYIRDFICTKDYNSDEIDVIIAETINHPEIATKLIENIKNTIEFTFNKVECEIYEEFKNKLIEKLKEKK